MKNAFRKLSIKRKLMAIILLTSGVVLLVVTLSFVTYETISFRRSGREKLAIVADVLGSNVTAALAFGDQHSATETLRGLSVSKNILAAYIITPDRKIFAKYLASGVEKSHLMLGLQSAGDQAAVDSNALAQMTKEASSAWNWDFNLHVARDILLEGQHMGTVVILTDSREYYSKLVWYLALVGSIMFVTLVVAFIIASRLQNLISDPIMHLFRTINTVTENNDYSIRAEKENDDELGVLIDGFNAMLTQIHLSNKRLQLYADELKQSNEEVMAFTYIVSHDLRTPLVNLKGFSGELRNSIHELYKFFEMCVPHLNDKELTLFEEIFKIDLPEELEFIESSVSRMDTLINAVLMLSRLGRRVLKPVKLQTEELVAGILKTLGHQLKSHNVAVSVGALPELTADRVAIEQIFGNLLDNAVKYMLPERSGLIEISAELEPKETTFHIRDNGRGIAEKDMDKIFEIFRRAGQQNVPGEGMGLTYVKTLVRRFGGRIWCESELGVGSVFSFTIKNKWELGELVE